MDVLSHKWVDSILEITGGKELRGRLKGEPVEGGVALGEIHPYWTRRWGFSPGASVLASGCSLPDHSNRWTQNVLLHLSLAITLPA